LPWSICAMIAKLRMCLVSMGAGMSFAKDRVSDITRGDERMRRSNGTEVRSKLEFIIGTQQAAALQWREDHV
jgi:hypothetical protein